MERVYNTKRFNPVIAGVKGTETDFAILLYFAHEVHEKVIHRYMEAGRLGDKDRASYQAKFLRILQAFTQQGETMRIRPLNPMILN